MSEFPRRFLMVETQPLQRKKESKKKKKNDKNIITYTDTSDRT